MEIDTTGGKLFGAAVLRRLDASGTIPTATAALLLGLAVSSRAHAAEDWMFAAPVLLPEPINLPNSMNLTPWLSADGLSLYFSSDRPGGQGGLDLWVSERASANDPWGPPTHLGLPINTSRAELGPSLSADGLTLYFMDGNPFGVNPRVGGPGNYQIWTSTRATRHSPWQAPVDLNAPVGSPAIESYPFLTADGLNLYFTSSRSSPGGLLVSERATTDAPWGTPVNLGSGINQGGWSGFPCLSSSGLHLLFYTDRSGGRGGNDLWMSTRPSVEVKWADAINLGPAVNCAYQDASPTVSSDFPALGSYMLFSRNNSSEWNTPFKIYRAEVIPSMTLYRRASLSEGSWIPVTASFTKVGTSTYEVQINPTVERTFYRVILNRSEGRSEVEIAPQSNGRLTLRIESVQSVAMRIQRPTTPRRRRLLILPRAHGPGGQPRQLTPTKGCQTVASIDPATADDPWMSPGVPDQPWRGDGFCVPRLVWPSSAVPFRPVRGAGCAWPSRFTASKSRGGNAASLSVLPSAFTWRPKAT